MDYDKSQLKSNHNYFVSIYIKLSHNITGPESEYIMLS